MRGSCALAASVVLWLCSLVQAQAPGTVKPSVELAPVRDVQLHPGATARVELDFRVGSGFHINSNQPKSNLLIPTALTLEGTPPVRVASVNYPAGEDQTFPFSPNEKLSVYSGDFALDALLRAEPNAPAGTYAVEGELRYQACDRSACYPPKSLPVHFKVTVK
jgi:Disulphide bond corrector protein DsbC